LVIDTITEIDKILATAEISCQINGVEFSQKCNLSDLRSSLHHLVKKSLSEKEYNQNFPTSFPSTQISYISNLEKWLNDLSVAVEKNVFKLQTKEKYYRFSQKLERKSQQELLDVFMEN